MRGERIEIRGFGSFVVKQRQAREGRNPKTGALVPVAAKRVPFFKVGKELRAARRRQAVDAATTPRRSTSALAAASMQVLWAPWRMAYIGAETPKTPAASSAAPLEGDPRERLLLGASPASVVMLNRYPVRQRAHLMVAPRRHTASLVGAAADEYQPTWPRRSGAPRHTLGERASPRGHQPRHEPRRVRRRRHRGPPALAHRAALDRRHQLHADAGRGARHARAPARHLRPSASGVRLADGAESGDVERASGSLVVSRATTCV